MKSNKEFLQKYVDHKLNSMRCDMDDLSDYLENYTDDACWINTKIIKQFGSTSEEFITSFKPTFNEVKDSIKRSKMLNVLAERYKQAVIKGISTDIFYNVLDTERRDIRQEIKEQEEFDKEESMHKSAMMKLKKAKLTKKELQILHLNCYL